MYLCMYVHVVSVCMRQLSNNNNNIMYHAVFNVRMYATAHALENVIVHNQRSFITCYTHDFVLCNNTDECNVSGVRYIVHNCYTVSTCTV